jgi:hypothetical protein
MDHLGVCSKFGRDLNAKLGERDGELIELDRLGIVFDDAGLAEIALYSFAIGGRIDLEQDDTLAVVRRKLAAELRELAALAERDSL